MTAELSPSRKIERRELISLFNGMAPGDEIGPQELATVIGLDPSRAGDRSLIYGVREHCRDVLGFVIQSLPGGRFRRATDEDIAGPIVERRRDRIYKQAARGAAESVAFADFDGLSNTAKMSALAHQSIFGAVMLASHRDTPRRVERSMGKSRALASVDPGEVMAVAKQVR